MFKRTEEIRTKNGNRRIPLSVGGETQAQTDAATEKRPGAKGQVIYHRSGHLSQVIRPPHHRLVPFPAPTEVIRAKNGNRRLPLSVGGETTKCLSLSFLLSSLPKAQTDAATETATTTRPVALSAWLQSSQQVRKALAALEK